MEDLTYAGFKQILLDWTATIAKASIDGTRSDEDAEWLRSQLARFIKELSSSGLRTSKVEDVVRKFRVLASEVSVIDDSRFMNIGEALNSPGASQKEFNEWAYGGLGKALKKQVESILGKYWEHS